MYGYDNPNAGTENTNVGEATVKITGIGNYVDTVKAYFTIDPFDLENAKVLGVDESYAYTGNPIKPNVKVLRLRKLLTEGVHYTVTYANNVEIGKAKVTVTGIGNCTGSVIRTFTIKPDIADATVASIDDLTYTGAALEPAVTVEYGGKTLEPGTDYTLSYADNVNAGTATVTIEGKGNYAGFMSREFTIAKAPQTIAAKNVKKTYKAKKGKLPKAKTIKLKKAAKVSAGTTVAYKKANKIGGSKIKVNAKTGKLTAKKGLKKGTFKVKVKLTAAEDANHLAAKAKKIAVKIKVK